MEREEKEIQARQVDSSAQQPGRRLRRHAPMIASPTVMITDYEAFWKNCAGGARVRAHVGGGVRGQKPSTEGQQCDGTTGGIAPLLAVNAPLKNRVMLFFVQTSLTSLHTNRKQPRPPVDE